MSNTGAWRLADGIARAVERGWARPGAAVRVAEDPAHALELLVAGRPGGCAAVVFYLSDDCESGDEGHGNRVAALVRVALVQAPGLRLRGGRAAPRVLELVDDFRRWAAAREFDGVLGGRLEYRGMTHIPAAAGSALHGYALTYAARYAFEVDAGRE